MVSLQSITHKSPSEVWARRLLFFVFARQPSAQRPSRLVVLPCRRWATRSAIAAHGPSPGRAALAPRRRARPSSLPAGRRPESPHLRARCSGGADLERARGGRRGGACAAGAGSRLAAWPARPFKFLSHSAAAKRAQSADWHVARGRSASPRRRSWPPARAQRPRPIRARLAGAALLTLRASALTPIARRYTREPKSRPEMAYVLGRPTMQMKPMLGDETEAKKPAPSFAALAPQCSQFARP